MEGGSFILRRRASTARRKSAKRFWFVREPVASEFALIPALDLQPAEFTFCKHHRLRSSVNQQTRAQADLLTTGTASTYGSSIAVRKVPGIAARSNRAKNVTKAC